MSHLTSSVPIPVASVRSSRNNELFCSFIPAVSPSALKAMRSTVRDLNIRQLTQRSLDDIARKLNPLLRGWIRYYGRYNRAALEAMLRHVNLTLVGWVMRKFKDFQPRKVQAARLFREAGPNPRQPLRTLAPRNDRRVRLMGAV